MALSISVSPVDSRCEVNSPLAFELSILSDASGPCRVSAEFVRGQVPGGPGLDKTVTLAAGVPLTMGVSAAWLAPGNYPVVFEATTAGERAESNQVTVLVEQPLSPPILHPGSPQCSLHLGMARNSARIGAI